MKLSEYLGSDRGRRIEFARLVGVTPATVTGWCNGSFHPSAKRASKIEEVTGGKVRVTDFVDEAAPAQTGAAR